MAFTQDLKFAVFRVESIDSVWDTHAEAVTQAEWLIGATETYRPTYVFPVVQITEVS